MISITVTHYHIVAIILFICGLYCMLTKRNLIGVLLGLELILNGANVNFVALGSPTLCGTSPGLGLDGQLIALFVIVLAAAEVAVALGIVLSFYHLHGVVDVDEANELKG